MTTEEDFTAVRLEYEERMLQALDAKASRDDLKLIVTEFTAKIRAMVRGETSID